MDIFREEAYALVCIYTDELVDLDRVRRGTRASSLRLCPGKIRRTVAIERRLQADDEVALLLQPGLSVDSDVPAFVEARVLLQCPCNYPSEPVSVSLIEERGLGDARSDDLLNIMRSEAESLRSEMMLAQVCEAGREYVSSHNSPQGPCAICLEEFTDSTTVVKLRCFHCFHR